MTTGDPRAGAPSTAEIAAFTGRLRELSRGLSAGTTTDREIAAFHADRDAFMARLADDTDTRIEREDPTMSTNQSTATTADVDEVPAPRVPWRELSSAELLARAEHADNVSYLGDLGQIDRAYRDLEAIEAEAIRRSEQPSTEHEDPRGDAALAAYVGFLIEDAGVERFDEYTALHRDVHHALGIDSVPPDMTAVNTESWRAHDAGHDADLAEGQDWRTGPDAARWSPDLDEDGPDAGLVAGTVVLPGGLPPEPDELDQAEERRQQLNRWHADDHPTGHRHQALAGRSEAGRADTDADGFADERGWSQ